MKRLTIILSMIAAPAFADGPSTFSDPRVTEPVCASYQFLWIKWNGECNAIGSFSPDGSDAVPLGGPDNTTPEKQPERSAERDKPTDTPAGQVKGDNSDANGKGGNKHDRNDKDKPSQEIAERKKGQ